MLYRFGFTCRTHHAWFGKDLQAAVEVVYQLVAVRLQGDCEKAEACPEEHREDNRSHRHPEEKFPRDRKRIDLVKHLHTLHESGEYPYESEEPPGIVPRSVVIRQDSHHRVEHEQQAVHPVIPSVHHGTGDSEVTPE